jgi:hypothetical protein
MLLGSLTRVAAESSGNAPIWRITWARETDRTLSSARRARAFNRTGWWMNPYLPECADGVRRVCKDSKDAQVARPGVPWVSQEFCEVVFGTEYGHDI